MPDDGPPIEAAPVDTVAGALSGRGRPGGLRPRARAPASAGALAESPRLHLVGVGADLAGALGLRVRPDQPAPAIAVSHDRGATWSQQPLPGTDAGVEVTPPGASTDAEVIALTTSIMIYPLASRDGVTAYVSVHDESAAQPPRGARTRDLWYARTFRTTDGGLTWRRWTRRR